MDFWYTIAKGICRSYLAFFADGFDIRGNENIEKGPKIIVANHPNATDSFYLPFIFSEKLHFLIDDQVFDVPIIGKLLEWADQIPVIAGRGYEALEEAIERLAQGHPVVIFPEGQLNHGEALRRAGSGTAILAKKSGAPLLPIGFYVPPEYTRTFGFSRDGRQRLGRWQIRGRCSIQIGEPWKLEFPSYRDQGYRSIREITNLIMSRIQNLAQVAEDNFKNDSFHKS